MSGKAGGNAVTRTVSGFLIPFIQLYSLYLIAHGDLGPGGGFQGGAIFAASIILYAVVFGLDKNAEKFFAKVAGGAAAAGLAIYGGIGLLCMAYGGNFLQYSSLPFPDPHTAHHIGIYGIEIGIGLTVAGAMLFLFMKTAGSDDA